MREETVAKMRERNEKYIYILIFLHLLIALPLAYLLNIWVDEASTLYTTENGISGALRNALANERQAPLYFWVLSLWREISSSVFFARLFSILCSLLAIKVFNDAARKLFDEKSALFITAFFALHPYLFWASLEIRVYSLVILLSITLLNLFYDGYLKTEETFYATAQSSQKRTQIYYVLVSIAALYTNYYLGFTLVGGFVALIITRKWRMAKRYLTQMIIAGIVFLPVLWAIKSQFAGNTSGFQTEKSLIEGLQILWNFFLTFVLPTEIFPSEEISALSIIRLWLARLAILTIVVLFIKNRRKPGEKLLAFGAATATIFVFLLVAYFLLGKTFVQIRHAAVLFAPNILFIGLVLEEVFTRSRKDARKSRNYSTFALAVLSLIFFGYSIFTLYPNLTKRGDWARIAEYIEKNEKPNQPIIVFTTFDALALPYHYHGKNVILPDEKFFDWEAEDAAGSANSLKKQTDFLISEIPPEAREIWLATGEICRIKESCQPLENFIDADYTIVETKDFYKEKLFLLRKKP